MPPAFNLSQDQTLQFNSCEALLPRRSLIQNRLQSFDRNQIYCFVSTAYICPEGLDVFSQYPHLSVDYFLKKADRFSFRIAFSGETRLCLTSNNMSTPFAEIFHKYSKKIEFFFINLHLTHIKHRVNNKLG